MKVLNTKRIKIICLMLIVIMMVNIITPLCSYADKDEDFGGELFKPIAKFLAGIADLVIKGLQKVFIGYGSIKESLEIGGTTVEEFKILYSPAVIFSNNVPGLNANFINPPEGTYIHDAKTEDSFSKIGQASQTYDTTNENSYKSAIQKCLNDLEASSEYGYSSSTAKELDGENKNWVRDMTVGVSITPSHVYQWKHGEDNYYLIQNHVYVPGYSDPNNPNMPAMGGYDKVEMLLYSSSKVTISGAEREYTSAVMQPTISKWYKALRLIAMVGLLSVLVYVGIRVIISSTGQEKAKYQKMLADWFAAMCILFILHYIMALIMTSVDLLTKVFSTKIIGDDGTDLLLSDIRGKLGDFGSFLPIFGDLVIYLALVILTCVFTVQYLKRLVYLAFLTMIAPLIALTYPLDKIKDGQAQAFTLWLREYTFNALLPLVHILIYAIFVSSASELVKENPIYAVVCIGFMVPAEKFIRKMFGFEKASTVSPLGAAAGGAMAMNIVNNLKKTGGGSGSGGSGGSGGGQSKVRTNGSGYIPAPGGGNGGTPGGNQPSGPLQPETNPNPAPNPQDNAPDTPPLQPTPNGDDDSDSDAPSSDRPLDNPNGQNDEQMSPDAPNPLENENNGGGDGNPDENPENENAQRGIIRNLATRAKNRRRKIKHAITRKIGALRGNITRRSRGRRGQQGGGNSGGSNGGPTNTDLRYNQQQNPPTFNPQNQNGGSNNNPAMPQEDINDVQEEVEHNEDNSGPSTSFHASSIFGEDIEQGNMNPNYSRLAGLTGVISSYINKPTIKKAATKAGKFAGRSLRKAIVGGIGVAALGTVGLAAGVASGDLSKAAQYTGAAALVGFKKANDIGDRLTKVEKQNRETYKENKWGTDEYETRNAIKEMEENREFLKVAKAAGLTKDQREKLIRKYYANGIVDQNKIMKALTAQQRINQMSVEERIKNGYGRNQITQNEMIAAQKLSQSISASYWGQPQNRIRFKQDLVTKGVHPEDAARAVALISYLKGDLS